MATFYAQKDGNGYPIPGTMVSTSGSVPSVSNLVTIPASNVVSTKVHPGGLRYFVRKDPAGNIIPNSLFIGTRAPKSGLYYEFKLA